jgi:hypothetical protein
MRPERPRVVIAGALASRAGKGGSTWARLHWPLAFAELGWDVLYLDRLDDAMAFDDAGHPCDPGASVNAAYFTRVMDDAGLAAHSSLVIDGGKRHVGLDRATVIERVTGAELLINIMGFLDDEEILGAARRRVFLDIDPGFTQMWHAQGLADLFGGYDDFVTIGENIGREGCSIPTCGVRWVTTPQPVVLDRWPVQSTPATRYTTIASWRGAYGPVEQDGRTFGLRVHEFRRFAALPRITGSTFELALSIDPSETKDLSLLRDNGWELADPRCVAADPSAYRGYVQRSRAEFMVAKNMYVDTRSGWFSDRTMCYLASGRPAIVQDTGFRHRYPSDEGLIAFSSLEEAAEAVDEIERDYERHARAARRVASEHFAGAKVAKRLVEHLEVVA